MVRVRVRGLVQVQVQRNSLFQMATLQVAVQQKGVHLQRQRIVYCVSLSICQQYYVLNSQ